MRPSILAVIGTVVLGNVFLSTDIPSIDVANAQDQSVTTRFRAHSLVNASPEEVG